jgi:hypothetical protein
VNSVGVRRSNAAPIRNIPLQAFFRMAARLLREP